MTTQTVVKERPILFKGEMVRAILEARKSQTRRIIKPQPPEYLLGAGRQIGPIYGTDKWAIWSVAGTAKAALENNTIRCPYGQPGDRLWVRETWAKRWKPNLDNNEIAYRADGGHFPLTHNPWKPSIHMKRADSRILLEVVSVKVERVQDITEADAQREGLYLDEFNVDYSIGRTYRKVFEELWNKINGNWVANPWVWVIEFKRLKP